MVAERRDEEVGDLVAGQHGKRFAAREVAGK
jgi:hypothetical protein